MCANNDRRQNTRLSRLSSLCIGAIGALILVVPRTAVYATGGTFRLGCSTNLCGQAVRRGETGDACIRRLWDEFRSRLILEVDGGGLPWKIRGAFLWFPCVGDIRTPLKR